MDVPVAGVAHQAGTCRFGTDPASSVLDINCKAHEVDNLYVVDTSFFPSIGARCYGRTTLTAGQSAFVALSWGGDHVPASQDEAFSALNTTVDFWRDWLSSAKIPDHPWKPYLDRSALTLKGLSYAPTGAIMAASTTSLPETPGGARNWDYRFTWIRDSAFMLRALYRLGFDWEAIEYWGFVIDAVSGGDLNRKFELQIMYGIGGERDLTERTLDHLSGYRGARPIRVGNGAWNQQQHDVWGMILDALDVQFHNGATQIVVPVWEGLAGFVDAALQHWREPDQGIWEVRGDPKHFTASKMMCWVAASRGADLAEERGADERAKRWRAAPMRLRPRSWTRACPAGGCSGNTTRPMTSTPRCCCCCPSWDSCPPRTSASERRS